MWAVNFFMGVISDKIMKIVKIDKKNVSQIRPVWEDLNKLHGELSTHFKEHFKSFSFAERMKQLEKKQSVAIFAAKEESDILGYCIASVEGEIGEIDSVFINPEHRNKSVGKRLIIKAESWLRSKHVIKIHVAVAEGNESVFEFYNKQGYYQRFTVFEKKA